MGFEKNGVIYEHAGVAEVLRIMPAFVVGLGCSMLFRSAVGPWGVIVTILIFLSATLAPPAVALHERAWAGLTGHVYLREDERPYREDLRIGGFLADLFASVAFGLLLALVMSEVFGNHDVFSKLMMVFAAVIFSLAHIGGRPRGFARPKD